MKTLIMLLIAIGVTGCATTAKYEKRLNTWVGHSEDELVSYWGSPSKVYETPSGLRQLTYNYNGGTYTNGQYNELLNTYQINSYTNWCKTTFTIELGVVKTWRWEGSNCVSN